MVTAGNGARSHASELPRSERSQTTRKQGPKRGWTAVRAAEPDTKPVGRLVTVAPTRALRSTEGLVRLWGLHKLWTVRCQRPIKKVQTTYLDVMTALETAATGVEQWCKNTQQQEASELSGKLAQWFWDRQGTLINHKVAYEERMAQMQQRLDNIRLEVGARISLPGQRKEHRKKRKQDTTERRRICPRRRSSPLQQYLAR